ncbi:MAG: glycoside hydrolase family 127 protein, partial [Prevotellaceae bacterium]|nr:glycoside hydrolase family 127 protein [Prevotellaceae bacterium]
MKYFTLAAGALCCIAACKQTASTTAYSDYPIEQVSLTQVELTDAFWLPRIQTIQKTTIQYAFNKCDSEGRFENFRIAARVMKGEKGKVRGYMPFDDTDVYKTIEGAAYSLLSAPDPTLEQYVDSIIGVVALGQEADGYLTTWRTIDPMSPPCQWVKPGERWTDLGSSHELYNSGHLFEAAAAHYRATGKRNFLDVATRNADLLVKVFGDTAKYEVPGHEIVETGLIKLYQITKNEDYLKLSRKFLDLRGDGAHRQPRGAYSQDHLPVTQQDEVVGHAVRAVYLYAGMTDIAAIYKDSAYRNAIDKLWANMVDKKMYLTGGLGARHAGEAFGDSYELPNLTAYSETCAAIGGVYWNERMFRLTGASKYYDVIERTLYNALIAGISLKGTEFFYPNPLEADGKYAFNQGKKTRQPWFDCSCCPTNLIRFIPYIPNLIYATQEDTAYVNLFISGKATIPLKGNAVRIAQETDYPWDGKVNIHVTAEKPQNLTLRIRIPGWALNEASPGALYTYCNSPAEPYALLLNGSKVAGERKNGYVEISNKWTGDDRIELTLPMKVRLVKSHEQVAANKGLVALEYGALVYCAEEADNSRFDEVSINGQTSCLV